MLKRLVVLLFAIVLSFSAAGASGEWIAPSAAAMNDSVWTYILEHDEAIWDGYTYTPLMLLGTDGEKEAWLVAAGGDAAVPDKTPEVSEGSYLVMYIQLAPTPKVIGTVSAGGALEEINPTCEIKLLLDSTLVLDEDHLLAENIRARFGTGEEYETIGNIYLDTAGREYLDMGWVNRIRARESKLKYTVTYKMRYSVGENDLEAALAAARADGFSLFDSQFPAEIDWGYSKMTLSFSADADVKTEDTPDLALLDRNDAVEMVVKNMPSEERDWGGPDQGAELADSMQIAGPVNFLRYSGILDGQNIRIEIWPVRNGAETQYITEFSTEYKSVKEAAGFRESVIGLLDEMGILIHDDALKTQMILDMLKPD